MLTVTFYSFRGGVGRTMALANVAAHLARSGQNVFLIDFDLEAPGLSLMPEFLPQTPPESAEGLVGYLRAALEDRELPSIRSLTYEPVLRQQLREQQSDVGAIHVLPADARAGTERQYELAKLQLERLYETQSRALAIDALKIQIEEHCRGERQRPRFPEQLGECPVRPSEDEDGCGSRRAVRPGGRKATGG
jgi:cellulose biosynthesis protein BcsQ